MHIDPMIGGITIVAPTLSNTPQSSLVLLVEDDTHICRLLCKILVEQQGFTVITSEQPEIALRFLQSHCEDVACVLTEIRFTKQPSIEGVKLVRRFKTVFPTIPVVALVGMTDHGVIKSLNRLDVRTIKKPFQIANVLTALQHAVALSRTVH